MEDRGLLPQRVHRGHRFAHALASGPGVDPRRHGGRVDCTRRHTRLDLPRGRVALLLESNAVRADGLGLGVASGALGCGLLQSLVEAVQRFEVLADQARVVLLLGEIRVLGRGQLGRGLACFAEERLGKPRPGRVAVRVRVALRSGRTPSGSSRLKPLRSASSSATRPRTASRVGAFSSARRERTISTQASAASRRPRSAWALGGLVLGRRAAQLAVRLEEREERLAAPSGHLAERLDVRQLGLEHGLGALQVHALLLDARPCRRDAFPELGDRRDGGAHLELPSLHPGPRGPERLLVDAFRRRPVRELAFLGERGRGLQVDPGHRELDAERAVGLGAQLPRGHDGCARSVGACLETDRLLVVRDQRLREADRALGLRDLGYLRRHLDVGRRRGLRVGERRLRVPKEGLGLLERSVRASTSSVRDRH